MALSLANMLARVKRIVPTTVLDTELQDAILERMNYLATMDVFPFQEGFQSATLAASGVSMSTPDNFAAQKSLVLYTADSQRPLTYLDPPTFDQMFPNPSDNDSDKPAFYTIKIAEGYYYFNCPADAAYTIYSYFHKIPDDATDTTVSQLTEMAKITLIHWAAADGFRMMKEYDRADKEEDIGGRFDAKTGRMTGMLGALWRKYQLSQENDARFISLKEFHKMQKAF